MQASDVMTTKVITVGPNTGVQEIANILLANRISAVPVVGDYGELLGIVSEGISVTAFCARTIVGNISSLVLVLLAPPECAQ
jgi:CBS domain-containing protein